MRKLSDTLTPSGWIIMILGGTGTLVSVLKPTLLEFLVMSLVDLLFYALIFKNVEFYFFQKIYPEVKSYFHVTSADDIQITNVNERVALIESFSRYPERRAIYSYLGSLIKVIPAFFIMVFYWHHEVSDLSQFLRVLGLTLIHFCYFASAVFIENHSFLSSLIEKLHAKYDYSEAFRKLKHDYFKKDLLVQEWAYFLFIILFMLGCQMIIIFTEVDSPSVKLAYKLAAVSLTGILLFFRIWYLGRKYLTHGLESIFKKIENLSYNQKMGQLLPVHSLSFLGKFDQTFNFLSDRLKQSERELSVLVAQEVDKSRFRALGEISALIAHDMSGPAHAVQFCLSQYKESNDLVQKDKYIAHLEKNLNRLIELLNSMKARLKNPSGDEKEKKAEFIDAHQYVVRLLETQFKEKEFHLINFVVDHELSSLALRISRVDLIHVLDNIYRNCVENLIKHAVSKPCIQVLLGPSKDKKMKIHVLDNGKGFSAEKFENLTGYSFSIVHETFQQGLGMRLTRRLLEHNEGSLSVIDRAHLEGTLFQIELNSI